MTTSYAAIESVLPEPPVGSLPPPPTAPRRILVVDDDLSRRNDVVRLLRDEGYVVAALPAGRHTIDFTRKAAPDVILLGQTSGPSSTIDLVRRLRRVESTRLTPIVIVADAGASEETIDGALRAGADDYVIGAMRPWELRARVRVQLKTRRDRELLQWAREQRSSFRDEALTDPLTGIRNRRAFDRALESAIDSGEAVTIVLVDLDHFKAINDTHGHSVGDMVLRGVARALESRTRRGDIAARFGGEEFAVVLRGASGDRALDIGERYRKSVSEMPDFEQGRVDRVTVSVGVAYWDGTGAPPGPSDLVSRADSALYESKRLGRDRTSVAPPRESVA
jgi:two-component system cell cycle response regulator